MKQTLKKQRSRHPQNICAEYVVITGKTWFKVMEMAKLVFFNLKDHMEILIENIMSISCLYEFSFHTN